MIFKVYKDTETSERAGAEGMYQIESLIRFKSHDDCYDDNLGNDVTGLVDVGMHFSSENDDLTPYLSRIFKIPESEVEYCYQNPKNHPDWPFK